MDYTNENLKDDAKSKLMGIENLFINMRASGKTVREIARKLKKSNQTISDLNKKYFRQVADLRNEKLEVLQRKMYEQKQERLDFLTEQLRIVKEAIKEKEIYMNYESCISMAVKLSAALNKFERDMQISDLLNTDFEDLKQDISQEQDEIIPEPETNVPEEKPDNSSENKEVKDKTANPGTAETKNKKPKKTVKKKGSDAPPKTRAEYYRKYSKASKPPE